MNNRTLISALVAIVVLAVIGGAWYAMMHNTGSITPVTSSKNSSSDTTKNTTNTAPQTTTPTKNNSTNTTPSTNAASTDSVTIESFAFSPASITVKRGTKVTWTNKDSVAHTVVESDGQTGPDSSSLQQGDTYSFTFNAAGTFHYQCSVHPQMTGTVTVTE